MTTADRNTLQPTEKNLITAWTLGMSEPLVPLHVRLSYQEDMIDLIEAKPHVVSSIFTGAISKLIRALPAEDPWRALNISADYEVTTPTGDPFGVESAYDIAEPRTTDRRLQPELAAMVEDIPDASKVLIAAAKDGWTATLSKAEAILPLASPTRDEADGIFQTLESALRWAAHRYGQYAGRESLFFVRSISLATNYYNAPMKNQTNVIDTVEIIEPEEKIEDGMWSSITDGDW